MGFWPTQFIRQTAPALLQDSTCYLFHRTLCSLAFPRMSVTPQSIKDFLHCEALTHAKYKNQTNTEHIPTYFKVFLRELHGSLKPMARPRKITQWNVSLNLGYTFLFSKTGSPNFRNFLDPGGSSRPCLLLACPTCPNAASSCFSVPKRYVTESWSFSWSRNTSNPRTFGRSINKHTPSITRPSNSCIITVPTGTANSVSSRRVSQPLSLAHKTFWLGATVCAHLDVSHPQGDDTNDATAIVLPSEKPGVHPHPWKLGGLGMAPSTSGTLRHMIWESLGNVENFLPPKPNAI